MHATNIVACYNISSNAFLNFIKICTTLMIQNNHPLHSDGGFPGLGYTGAKYMFTEHFDVCYCRIHPIVSAGRFDWHISFSEVNMRHCKTPIIVMLLLTLSLMLATPAAPVSAASLTDVLPQLSSDTGSGSGLINILLGLLLGKFLGNAANNGISDSNKGLGATTIPSATVTSSGATIVATAQKYMGVPYVWGGETPDGWDCSGFTMYVMKENGITLPRTAAEQFAVGTPVDKDSLQPGDLVFFTTYKPGASHVGFYMGNGQFIHASSAAKQVTISNLADKYYTDHYIGARRYVN
jgi:cell wall-associated NlpC family hydrolase